MITGRGLHTGAEASAFSLVLALLPPGPVSACTCVTVPQGHSCSWILSTFATLSKTDGQAHRARAEGRSSRGFVKNRI